MIVTFALIRTDPIRGDSSAGEQLPYKQQRGGSNPSRPTKGMQKVANIEDVFCLKEWGFCRISLGKHKCLKAKNHSGSCVCSYQGREEHND